MKYLHIITALLLISLFCASCIDDKGNYDYEDPDILMPVKISGLEDVEVILGSVLELTPNVENLEDESRYTYAWYAIPQSGFVKQTKEILGTERNLSAQIKLNGGIYDLYYKILDNILGIYKLKKVRMVVNESFLTKGWYLLKDKNNETDFDYLTYDDIKEKYELYSDVIKNLKGRSGLKGNAVKITYQSGDYAHEEIGEDGKISVLTGLRVFHIVATEEMNTVLASNINILKQTKEQFYEYPEVWKPQGFNNTGPSSYLINNGKLHILNGLGSGKTGKYGGAVLPPNTSHCDIHSNLMTTFIGGAFLFDNLSRTFYSAGYSASELTQITDNPSIVSIKNMNYKLVCMLQKEGMPFAVDGYVIMQSINDPENYRLATMGMMYSPGSGYPFGSFEEIPRGSLVSKALIRAVPSYGSFIYFGEGNKLYAYKTARDVKPKEPLLKEFPVGETVAYIRHASYLEVVTNSSTGWKLYLFKILGAGPELESNTPEEIFEGEGNVRDVIYRTY